MQHPRPSQSCESKQVKFSYLLQRIDTAALTLHYFVVSWDTEIFGVPVAQIERIEVRNPAAAARDFIGFETWMAAERIQLVSCRLPHDRLNESMFLEDREFRFIELVYPLCLDGLRSIDLPEDGIEVIPACAADFGAIRDIARTAFATGRYTMDPRLDRDFGGRRYAAWVESSFDHPTQRVYKVCDGGAIVAFFVTEMLPGARVYWHLTAVAPAYQGKGFGKRAWRAMLLLNRQQGAERVETTIAARNTPVVNLYVDLHFRFQPPLMTFHRWRQT